MRFVFTVLCMVLVLISSAHAQVIQPLPAPETIQPRSDFYARFICDNESAARLVGEGWERDGLDGFIRHMSVAMVSRQCFMLPGGYTTDVMRVTHIHHWNSEGTSLFLVHTQQVVGSKVLHLYGFLELSRV